MPSANQIIKYLSKVSTVSRKMKIIWRSFFELDPFDVGDLVSQLNMHDYNNIIVSNNPFIDSVNISLAEKTNKTESLRKIEETVSLALSDGRFFWGRSSTRLRSASSWSYVYAAVGKLISNSIDPKEDKLIDAAKYFHWAANQFRAIGQFDHAIKYYYISAHYFCEVASRLDDEKRKHCYDQSLRSLQRGAAIRASVGEIRHSDVENLMNAEIGLLKEILIKDEHEDVIHKQIISTKNSHKQEKEQVAYIESMNEEKQ